MSTIQIGGDIRPLADVDESWVAQQVNQRQREGLPLCVQVTIRQGGLDMILTTPDCGSGTGGSPRRPTAQESAIFDLWHKHKLNTEDLSGGNLIAFIKQLRRHL